MELAKIGEVAEAYADSVNTLLAEGWVLLGFVERQYTVTTTRPDKSRAIYIVGKPRVRLPMPTTETAEQKARRKDDEMWRRANLPIDDSRHPDFHLHAKGSS